MQENPFCIPGKCKWMIQVAFSQLTAHRWISHSTNICPFLCLHWFLSMAVCQRDRVQTEPIISNSASPLCHVLGRWMKECCVFWPYAPLSQQMRESFTLGHKTKSHSWWKAPVIEKKTSCFTLNAALWNLKSMQGHWTYNSNKVRLSAVFEGVQDVNELSSFICVMKSLLLLYIHQFHIL